MPVGVITDGVTGELFALRFTGIVCGCVVEFEGVNGVVVSDVPDSSTGLPWPQAKQVNMNAETAKKVKYFILQI